MWATWANALTAVRGLTALPCAWLVGLELWLPAAALLSLALLSDLLDGPLARRLGQTSALGGLFDHATDAVFVTCLLTALWYAGIVPWQLPVLVAAAFAQYTVDSRALRGRPLRGSQLGRINGIGYFVVAAAPVYRHGFELPWPSDAAVAGLAWLLVVSTVVSMTLRLRRRLTAE
jgi:cardiolipin synthase (CMP-forming)